MFCKECDRSYCRRRFVGHVCSKINRSFCSYCGLKFSTASNARKHEKKNCQSNKENVPKNLQQDTRPTVAAATHKICESK